MYDYIPLKDLCQRIIDEARTCGVMTVPHLTEEEYGDFIVQRKEIVAQQVAAIEEERKAKLLRQAAKGMAKDSGRK